MSATIIPRACVTVERALSGKWSVVVSVDYHALLHVSISEGAAGDLLARVAELEASQRSARGQSRSEWEGGS